MRPFAIFPTQFDDMSFFHNSELKPVRLEDSSVFRVSEVATMSLIPGSVIGGMNGPVLRRLVFVKSRVVASHPVLQSVGVVSPRNRH